ncbi:MAG: PQQ-dependent sugar dehydrogenase [Phycisphaerales bacterium]|nr:PQQ-dependent sugar dehydrogenase [Phycisphaerales bacterium]
MSDIRARIVVGVIGLIGAGSTAQAYVPINAVRIARGLLSPTFVTHAPGDESRLFALEKIGTIRIIRDGLILPTPFLDLTAETGTQSEQGMLGLAFDPNYAASGVFYINHSNLAGDTIIARYHVDSNDPDRADPMSREVLLKIIQPNRNHNGGWVGFGPDGMLYISTGDGGSQCDPQERAQRITGELLGKILRIDVRGDDFPADPNRNYAIPLDNPFVGTEGDDEIWAYGLRNPWRCSFDRETGDFWIADVGQNDWEEVNFQPAEWQGGTNYGWDCREAYSCTDGPCGPDNGCECNDPTLHDPIIAYGHENGRCSITGGYVYRGDAIPGLQGTYFYGDYCTGDIFSLRYENDVVVDARNRKAELTPAVGVINRPTSFGEDACGELLIVDSGGGEIYQIVANCPCDADVTGDSRVDLADLAAMLAAFGHALGEPGYNAAVDLTNDDVVDLADLAAMLADFGCDCTALAP